MTSSNKQFDLEERTSRFSLSVIFFLSRIQRTPISVPLITQLVRSATNVGANYSEANNACSRADFKHKISICRKEAREATYWLGIFVAINDCNKDLAKKLGKQAHELNLIFNAIILKTEANNNINKLVIT